MWILYWGCVSQSSDAHEFSLMQSYVLNMSLWLGQLGNHASRMTLNLID